MAVLGDDPHPDGRIAPDLEEVDPPGPSMMNIRSHRETRVGTLAAAGHGCVSRLGSGGGDAMVTRGDDAGTGSRTVRSILSRRTLLAALGTALVLSLPSGRAGAVQDLQNLPRPAPGKPAPDVTFETLDGRTFRLSDFRGRPVMLWLIATWCPTCEASAQALAEKAPELEETGLVVITLKLYENLGYPGPSIGDFAKKWAPTLLDRKGWYWGEAGMRTSYVYDRQGYPDIYWLVDRDGIARMVNTAPNVTMDEIVSFAAGS